MLLVQRLIDLLLQPARNDLLSRLASVRHLQDVEHPLPDGDYTFLRAPEAREPARAVRGLGDAEHVGDGPVGGGGEDVRPEEDWQSDEDREVGCEHIQFRLKLLEADAVPVRLHELEERDQSAERLESIGDSVTSKFPAGPGERVEQIVKYLCVSCNRWSLRTRHGGWRA